MNPLHELELVADGKIMPPIERIRELFVLCSDADFSEFVSDMLQNNKRKLFELFLYYLLLFRDEKKIQQMINDPAVPRELLEHLLIFSFGYISLKGRDVDSVLDELLYFISQDRLVDLVIHSSQLARDKMLTFFILTRLDRVHLERFFAETPHAEELVGAMMNLPDNMVREIILRNMVLFDYMKILLGMYSNDGDAEEFYHRYRTEIEETKKINQLLNKYRRQQGKDNDAADARREVNRIALLVNMVDEMGSGMESMEYLTGSGVFADDVERKTVYEVMSNPLFKETLRKLRQNRFFGEPDNSDIIIF